MKIVPMEVKPNADAIEVLEKALEMARNGEIISVGISWVEKDETINGEVSAGGNAMLMWASLEHAARNFYANIILA